MRRKGSFKHLENLINNSEARFPGRAGRTKLIGEFLAEAQADNPRESVLCGRVIGLLDGKSLGIDFGSEVTDDMGFLIQDVSGKLLVLSENLPQVGSLVEIRVKSKDNERATLVDGVKILADCEDFYISFKDSPNYKRMVLDERLRDHLLVRTKIMAAIREFFVSRDFIDVDTPELVRLPGMEPYLDVFRTRFEANLSKEQKLKEKMYLITSPEYAMKKLLVGGMEKIFQITKAFRNKETFSERHNPEFTILEWYRAYSSYLEIMEDTEALVKFLWEKFGLRDGDGRLQKIKFGDKEVDVMAKWERLKVIDAFAKYAGIDAETFGDEEKLRAVVKERGYAISDAANFDDLFFTIFLNEIEPKLGIDVPTTLYDYPVSMAALSKPCEDDERFAERFEVYIGGLELCNAFTELNDPAEQERRLRQERDERAMLGKEVYDIDETFIEALKFGMPPAGGNALGVDRLIMLILGVSDIRNVLFFPHRDL